MASKDHSSGAAAALRQQLEHIELQQQELEVPISPISRSGSPMSAGGQSQRSASRTRASLDSARRIRFSGDLPDDSRLSWGRNRPRRQYHNLQLETGLYTINSNVDVNMDRGRSRPEIAEGAPAPRQGEASSSNQHPATPRGRSAETNRHSGFSSYENSPAAEEPLPSRLEGFRNVKGAMITAAESNVRLAHYRDWVARQKERNRKWTSRPAGRIKVRINEFYKTYIVEGLLRQKPLPTSVDGRHIPLSPGLARRKQLTDERTGKAFVTNFIRSSRYTVWDFFPKQLFFQFSKLANFYFLVIGVLQMIPGLSTTGTYTTIGPLMAFVAISMGKEGYDDYRRYKLDKLENRSEAWVLDPAGTVKNGGKKGGGLLGLFRRKARNDDEGMTELEGISSASEEASWSKVPWQDVRVGDIIRLRRDDSVPADMVLLHATGPNGIAYIETMALDGETNLKSKQACPLLAERCNTPAGMVSCDAVVVSEDPNLDLYNFEGRATVKGETVPLTMHQVVYRGSNLRNTDQAIGLVINTGEECKIRMNAHKNAHAKAPAMQDIANRIVILLVVFVALLSIGCTIGNEVWKVRYERRAWYLHRAQVPFKGIIMGFIIEFNTLIPLSLYVSLEIIKLGQLFLLQDVEMYDPVSDTPMVANTTNILENLGQVSYVFSDKTGTLTENVMRFRKMSVAGTAWLHDMDLQREAEDKERKRRKSERRKGKGKGTHTSQTEPTKKQSQSDIRQSDDVEPIERPLIAGQPRVQNQPQRSNSQWKSTVRPAHAQPELKTEDLIAYLRRKPHTPFSRKARHFILCIALCHTCLPEKNEKGEITFQAASPDELALVDAAKDLGYLVIDRPAQSIKLQFRDFDGSTITENYEVLDVIEFSSKRKRMSIIIRMPDGKTCIFTKGADSAILPRLKANNLAAQKASAVERRASVRKSVEQEKALQRRSTQTNPRDSINLARAAQRMSLRKGSARRSASMGRRTSVVTDEVDSWLNRRETEELDQQLGNAEAYQIPRGSVVRQASLEYTSPTDDPYDGLVDESLAVNDGAVFERCFQHIDDFASEGLRTLLFAYRYLEEDDYKKWKTIYHDATTSLVNRQERIEAAAELIEQGFDLAGASAIEDKLQQGVPDTIDKLRRAHIKVWMLTGDKRETAINIAQSARLCKPFSEVYILDATHGDLQERIASTLIEVGRGMIPHSVVVIDGHTLSVVEEDESLKILFLDLAARVDSVICCRASPSQKATLVKSIRLRVPSSITLAIGDGANDIAMIQASHVGIGISGKEGLQAARISDYSIAQFRFLQRLLFVHGRWNYIRTGKYILGTFWKEIVFYLVQAQYQRYNGYTGTSLYEPASLTVFNTLFTSLPVILLGIFEQDLRAETLLAVPELYSFGQKNLGFSFRKYLVWMVCATVEAVLIYHAIYGIYSSALFTTDTTLFAMGSLAFTICVIFINLKMLVLEMHNQTLITFLGLFISVSGWFTWNIFLGAIYAELPGPYIVRGSFMKNFGRNPSWWVTGVLTLAAVVIFELVIESIRRVFWPRDQDLMQELEKDEGMMDVMREHAAERGEAGGPDGAGFAVQEVKGGESRTVDGASVKTSMSAVSAEVVAWEWQGSGQSGFGSATSAVSGRRGSRHLVVDEYVPPPFTPPAEERENPMDLPHNGDASNNGKKDPGGKPTGSWLGGMHRSEGQGEEQVQGQANPYFTQSPIELRLPPFDQRRKQGGPSGAE